MGIKGLLPALKEYIQPVHISKYSGKRVSILFFFFDNVFCCGCLGVLFFFLGLTPSLSIIRSFIFFFQSTYSLCVSSFCHSINAQPYQLITLC